ncbi:MAG: SDR family NAD(P)-dependent oxidoreductase, partial [Planctomycetota bacterium]
MTQAILVTGSSSGIGRHLVEHLASEGHVVYATARSHSDLETLARVEGIVPVELDVRRPEQIARAVALIEKAGRGLDALVNNAGVGGIGQLCTFIDGEMRDLFEVNVFG